MKRTHLSWGTSLLLVAALVLYYVLENGRQTGPSPPPGPSQNPAEVGYPHLRWGNPSGADAGNRDNYLMEKKYYALSYNNTKGTPNWVSWRLVREDLGDADREGLVFQPDDGLPGGFKRIVTEEYSGSGFDRGHMCPAADRGSDMEALKATFVMTNVVPQSAANNEKGWEKFESYCRSLAEDGKELYVVSGPQGQGGKSRGKSADFIAHGQVVVPAKTWKVVMELGRGGAVDANTRLIAVVMPNDETVDNNWGKYRVAVRAVEQLTGYHFFDRADPAVLDPLKEQADASPIPPPREHHR